MNEPAYPTDAGKRCDHQDQAKRHVVVFRKSFHNAINYEAFCLFGG